MSDVIYEYQPISGPNGKVRHNHWCEYALTEEEVGLRGTADIASLIAVDHFKFTERFTLAIRKKGSESHLVYRMDAIKSFRATVIPASTRRSL